MQRDVSSGEAFGPAWATVARAAALASAVVVLALSTIGRLTVTWGTTSTAAFHVLDSAAYGAIIGGAAGSVLLAAERSRQVNLAPEPSRLARLRRGGLHAGAALLAGAAVGAAGASAGWLLEVRRGSVGALLLFLAGSVAFGAAVGTAARAGNAGTAAMGGAIGGFGVWLAANALHGVVAPTTSFASWRALAEDPSAGERFVRHGVGAALPAVLVPLGIATLEELRRLWRG